MSRIHLIVPTTTRFSFTQYLMQYIDGQNVELSESWVETGPATIESEYDELFAGPATVIEAIKAENDGADAIVIVCMGDPALHQSREAVSIPVLGLGETAMHFASMLGHKFSLLPTLERRRRNYEDRVRLYGLESKLASIRPTNIPVSEIANHETATDTLVACALKAIVKDNADVIILGCGCFNELDKDVEDALARAGHEVPVIDAIRLTVLTAITLVGAGLRHSKTAYPFPPSKEMRGYAVPERATESPEI